MINNKSNDNNTHNGEFEFVADKDYVGDDTLIDEPEDNIESDPFLHSLENLTPDDIAADDGSGKKPASERISDIARNLTLIICIAIFAGSLLYILRTLYYYKLADEIYGDMSLELDLAEIFSQTESAVRPSSQLPQSTPTPNFVTSMSLTEEDYAKLEQDETNDTRFALIKAYLSTKRLQNKDVYGYIKIANTNVDDIVVQTADNSYYLNHSWKGDYLPNGAIFTDYRCFDNVLKNFNTIIYGHHMSDGTMFNTLDYFFEEEFFRENKYIELYTFDGIFTYEVFAVYITDENYQYIRTAFSSSAQFVEFANEMMSNSEFVREGMEFAEGDRILTLSTCTNRIQTERIAVQAKLVKIER